MLGNLGLKVFAAAGGVGPAAAASVTSCSHNCLVLTASTDIPESTPFLSRIHTYRVTLTNKWLIRRILALFPYPPVFIDRTTNK